MGVMAGAFRVHREAQAARLSKPRNKALRLHRIFNNRPPALAPTRKCAPSGERPRKYHRLPPEREFPTRPLGCAPSKCSAESVRACPPFQPLRSISNDGTWSPTASVLSDTEGGRSGHRLCENFHTAWAVSGFTQCNEHRPASVIQVPIRPCL